MTEFGKRDNIVVDNVNSLKTRIGKGYLSNLVHNLRNIYLTDPNYKASAIDVRILVEGFMTELFGTEDEKKDTSKEHEQKGYI